MKRSFALIYGLTLCFVLSGCGVLYSYINNEDRLDQPLSSIMTRSEVEQTLGTTGKVVRDNGHVLVLEYRFYPRYHWLKEILACPFTAWLGGCLFYPAIGVGDPNYPKPYYVVLHEDRLCVWGTLEAVSTSTACQFSAAAATTRR